MKSPESSDHFRLAAVWVPTHQIADDIRKAVAQVRRVLELPTRFEFKFSKSGHRPDQRTAFYRAAMRHGFLFAYSSIDKRVEPFASSSIDFIHQAACVHLAMTMRPFYLATGNDRLKDRVVVDDCRNGFFLKEVGRAFRGLGRLCQPRMSLVGDVVFKDSAEDDLLQLADMVCGAVSAREDDVENDRWYEMIAERDMDRYRS